MLAPRDRDGRMRREFAGKLQIAASMGARTVSTGLMSDEIDPLDGSLPDDADLGATNASDDEREHGAGARSGHADAQPDDEDAEDDIEQALPGGAAGARAEGDGPLP